MVYFSNLNYTKSESDARYAKLGAANRFLGVNTFNRPINISASNAIAKTGNSINVVELTDQNEKTMTFDFIQPTSGFRNYCNVFFRIKEADGAYQTGYKIQIRNNDAGLYFSTACNFYEYDNKEIKGVANPTTNTSVANKQYVDTTVTGLMKRKTIRLGDLQYREQQTAGNFKIFWFGGQYSNQTTNITKDRFVNILFNNNQDTSIGNRVNIALNFYTNEYKVGLFDSTTSHANNYWDDATITIIYI